MKVMIVKEVMTCDVSPVAMFEYFFSASSIYGIFSGIPLSPAPHQCLCNRALELSMENTQGFLLLQNVFSDFVTFSLGECALELCLEELLQNTKDCNQNTFMLKQRGFENLQNQRKGEIHFRRVLEKGNINI